MADLVELVVNGARYSGWKSLRVTRSVESLAGSFAFDVSDRWDGSTAPWPIAEGDKARVEIDGDILIDGYIGKRSISAKADARTLTYSGGDRTIELVECSAIPPKWTYCNTDLEAFATTLAKPFGISVSVQPGVTLTKQAKLVVHPGDKVYEALRRAAVAESVLLVSDGVGGMLITRAGTARATPLIEGENIKEASVEYDASERFYRYVLATQVAGTDDASGDATRIQAEATDEAVSRTERVLMIRPEKGYGTADARRRVDWEARTRAAKAETVTSVVQGWRQPDGTLWPLNATTHVKAPTLIGVDGDLLISQVEHSIGEGGRITQLRLVRPDAFTPEPKATVKASGGAWKELAKGGL